MKFTKKNLIEAMGLKVGDILVNPQVVYVVTDNLELLDIAKDITFPLFYTISINFKVVRKNSQNKYFNYKMKFTNEMFAEAMGLKVGTIFQIKEKKYRLNENFQAVNIINNIADCLYDVCFFRKNEFEYEIIPTQKVGNTKCIEYNRCDKCPLQYICRSCFNTEDESLYRILEQKLKMQDPELYYFFKKRLDEEM